MINWRMLAIAGALLLIVPIGVFADPASDALSAGGNLIAHVDHLQILSPAVKSEPLSEGLHKQEELVEGHIVWVTIEAVANGTAVEGDVSVAGFVNCNYEVNATTSSLTVRVGSIGVPVLFPTGAGPVDASCAFGDTVIATPTIYCQVTGDFNCDPPQPIVLRPNGRVIDFVTGLGESAFAIEYQYDLTDAEGVTRTYYAWETPVMHPWAGANGDLLNMMLPVPADRLDAMPDQDHFVFLRSDHVQKGEPIDPNAW